MKERGLSKAPFVERGARVREKLLMEARRFAHEEDGRVSFLTGTNLSLERS